MPTTIPTVYQFLYQEEGAGESSSFLLGYDTNKYYLHNDFDYTDANLSLKPGVSLSLQSPKVSIAIGNTANDYFKLTNSANTDILYTNDEETSIHTKTYFLNSVSIGTNQTRTDFTGWLSSAVLYTNNLTLQGFGTASGSYHSRAVIQTNDDTKPKMHLGVYANSADETSCKIDSTPGWGKYGSTLSLGGQATEINLEVSGNQYFKVGVEENKTDAYVKYNNAWSPVVSEGVLDSLGLRVRTIYFTTPATLNGVSGSTAEFGGTYISSTATTNPATILYTDRDLIAFPVFVDGLYKGFIDNIEMRTSGSGQGYSVTLIITTTTNDQIKFDTTQITKKEKRNIKVVKTPN